MSNHPFLTYRSQFPIFKHSVQLSSCSQSALHVHVKEAVQHYMNTWEQHGMDWDGWMQAIESAREHFATLIHAEIDEITVVSSVSHAASAIANSLDFSGERQQILLTEMDFPCIGHVWLSQQKRGAAVNFVSQDSQQIPVEKYEQTIDSQTLLTSISHVAYYNGFKQNLKEIAQIAHSKGSYLFVDAYQSAGQVPIDVKESDIDFLTTGMQKYLLGLPGIAFLYVKKEIAEQLTPSVTGWFGQSNPFAFDIKHVDYASGARRFDSGTAPMINGFAASAALQLLLEIGVEQIAHYLQKLSQYTLEYAQAKGLTVCSPLNPEQKGSTTAIYVPAAAEMEQKMKQEGVVVSARNDVIRIAPHFYNSKEDITQAIDKLAELLL